MALSNRRDVRVERRRSRRTRMIKEGLILRGGDQPVVRCVVFDLSEHGARLRLLDDSVVPERFQLRIGDGPARPARVVRTTDGFVHVAFA